MTPALLGNLGVSLALAFSLLGLGLALLAYLQGDGRFSSTTSAWPTWRGTTPPRTPSG